MYYLRNITRNVTFLKQKFLDKSFVFPHKAHSIFSYYIRAYKICYF